MKNSIPESERGGFWRVDYYTISLFHRATAVTAIDNSSANNKIYRSFNIVPVQTSQDSSNYSHSREQRGRASTPPTRKTPRVLHPKKFVTGRPELLTTINMAIFLRQIEKQSSRREKRPNGDAIPRDDKSQDECTAAKQLQVGCMTRCLPTVENDIRHVTVFLQHALTLLRPALGPLT